MTKWRTTPTQRNELSLEDCPFFRQRILFLMDEGRAILRLLWSEGDAALLEHLRVTTNQAYQTMGLLRRQGMDSLGAEETVLAEIIAPPVEPADEDAPPLSAGELARLRRFKASVADGTRTYAPLFDDE